MPIYEYLKKSQREIDFRKLVKGTITNIYIRIWPYLPRRGYVTWAGVKVGERKWFDTVFGLMASDNPDHEKLMVSSIRKYVSSGDTVVEIGGGSGVSAVIAANEVGESGEVITFEASENMIELIENTVELNDVSDNVVIKHGVVSNSVRIMKRKENGSLPQIVSTDEIPNCDTLIIDCDGCEFDVLDDLSDPPPTTIVEHHAVLDCDERDIAYRPSLLLDLLEDFGYKIIDENVQKMDGGFKHKFGEEEIVVVGRQKEAA